MLWRLVKTVRLLVAVCIAGLIPICAAAADLPVMVLDGNGKPLRDAVVTFTPVGGANISAADLKGPFLMSQRNVMFDPPVLVVPVGAIVRFPNFDRVQHHVYSFSKAQPFQFPLYGKGNGPTMKFEHEGTVALGCNIHDAMVAYIRIVSTPYYAKTGDDGRVSLNPPLGAGTLSVWAVLNGREHQLDQAINVNNNSDLQIMKFP